MDAHLQCDALANAAVAANDAMRDARIVACITCAMCQQKDAATTAQLDLSSSAIWLSDMLQSLNRTVQGDEQFMAKHLGGMGWARVLSQSFASYSTFNGTSGCC